MNALLEKRLFVISSGKMKVDMGRFTRFGIASQLYGLCLSFFNGGDMR